jgi:hypothetical protein
VTPLDPSDTKRIRSLIDDLIHEAHVAGEPARDWGAWALDQVGAGSLADLTADQAVRLVDRLRRERDRLRSSAATTDAGAGRQEGDRPCTGSNPAG